MRDGGGEFETFSQVCCGALRKKRKKKNVLFDKSYSPDPSTRKRIDEMFSTFDDDASNELDRGECKVS